LTGGRTIGVIELTRPDDPRNDHAEPDDWRHADLRVRQSRRGLRVGRLAAWGGLATAFVVLMMSVQRDPVRCHPNCFDGSDRTFESGHVWTAYADSWQWEVQHAISWLGLFAALWAVYAAGRKSRRMTTASLGLTALLVLGWILWITVQPGPGQPA
jgi:hypothetical protein